MADEKRNSQDARTELKQFAERILRLEEDKAAVATEIKEAFAEAKGRGYDTKVLRKVLAETKRDKDELAEELAVLDMYREALGLTVGGSYTDEPEDSDDGDMV